MGTSVRMAGGSLAERQDTYQRPGQRHRARGQHALPDHVGQRGRGPEGVGRSNVLLGLVTSSTRHIDVVSYVTSWARCV